ncbi:alpha-galactosidase [Breznakia blatticola]|uniref:Alpha-galactosidase n=1 Tax=Breznakia blatticola TaxID=1754012 RepID=A0A4R7ZJG3_9FIRM|nr:alpha-galactosidase [Breznakia blatticola]TDW16538.1 alpha-galactosidase [Breznakia blatticola]
MIVINEKTKVFHLQNHEMSYIFEVMKDGSLGNLYFGKKVHVRDHYDYLHESEYRPNTAYVYKGEVDFSREHLRQEFPVYGSTDFRQPAITVQQENGSTISAFVYESHNVLKGKPTLKGLPATYVESDDEAETLEITLKDPVTKLRVVLSYSIYENLPIITRSVRVHNEGTQKLHLQRLMSMSLDLPDMKYEMLQLSGAWCRERVPHFRPLTSGIQAIESNRGSSSHYQNPFLALKRENATEHYGEVIGFSFVYSGNFLAQVEVDTYDVARVSMGINPMTFDWVLEPNQSFQAPEVVIAYSQSGLNGMSQAFHTLYRTRLARGVWRDKERPVLINNWEATGMNFTEDLLVTFAKQAYEDGVELFVLDDGWFGGRRHERAGLGDWVANSDLLPNGIHGLANRIEEIGLKFGLWFEPEMANEDSDLYRKHPDWIIQTPDRSCSHGRHQYVLDYSQKQVVDAIYEMMAKILRESKVSYIKWDMNRCITEPYTSSLPPERQGEVFHRYILGVYDLYERLTSEFPDILFEFCASGGGRFDPGMLYYSPQGWASDDSDAIERLKIQYGTSMVYPLSSIGAHVSVSPNEQVFRETPISTRGNVAYFGSFGYELDPTKLSKDDREMVRQQISFVKQYRKIIHQGTFYRLMSPFEGNYTAWMVVSQDQKTAIVGYYKVLNEVNGPFSRLYLQGLNEQYMYEEISSKQVYYGDELQNIGFVSSDASCGQVIDGRPTSHDFDSKVWVFQAK